MRILLVEDDPFTAEHARDSLVALGHDVLCARCGSTGLALGLAQSVDALVIDRMLPGLDGLGLLAALRRAGVTVPAVLLTAMGGLEDRVDGLNAGADDYMVKPFAVSELVARLHAVQRRYAGTGTRLVAGPLVMNLVTRTVHRDGRPVSLQPREFRLLEELIRHAGHYLTRSMLLQRVWNIRFNPGTKIIEAHICRLRTKLNEGGLPDLIETVRGQGYRLPGPETEPAAQAGAAASPQAAGGPG